MWTVEGQDSRSEGQARTGRAVDSRAEELQAAALTMHENTLLPLGGLKGITGTPILKSRIDQCSQAVACIRIT